MAARALRPRAALAALAAALPLAWAAPAAAHPHVWVNVETEVLYDNGSITGFRHRWTFDEYYTAMAIEGLDKNGDGQYSREELAELAKVNIDGLKEFAFFTFPKLGEQALALEEPKDYWLEAKLAPKPETPPAAPTPAEQGILARLKDKVLGAGTAPEAQKPEPPAHILTLVFTLPLKQPVLAEAADFNFAIQDPSFFIAFDLAKTEPVKLSAGAPQGCRVDLGLDEPEAQASGAAKAPAGTPATAPAAPGVQTPDAAGGPMMVIPGNKPIRILCPRS